MRHEIKWRLQWAAIASMLLLLLGGAIGLGFWLGQHYRIVRVSGGDGAEADQEPFAVRPAKGPFQYRFKQGEVLRYGLNARIRGTGVEAMAGPGNVAMTLQSDISVETRGVDARGNGELRYQFERVRMTGSFMDGPVEFRHTPEETSMMMDGRETIPRDAGGGQGRKGPLTIFQTPIDMTIAPDGTVLALSGPPGIDRILMAAPVSSFFTFPDPELGTGGSWTSEFSMPVPGMNIAAPATAVNTFQGYRDIGGRRCAAIKQEIASRQQDAVMTAPRDVLGNTMQFTVPQLSVEGQNLIYFDTNNGKLVRADLDLGFNVELGQEFKGVATLLDTFGGLLNELEGMPQDRNGEPKESLLKLGLNIQGSLALQPDSDSR